MEPIKFKEANVEFAKNQPQYRPMWAYKSKNREGQVVSCWKLSLKERFRLLFTGKLWVSLMMFGNPLTPSKFSTEKSDVITNNEAV